MTTVQHAHALSSEGEGSGVESTGLPEEPPAERDAALDDWTADEGPAPVDTPPVGPDEMAAALSEGDVG